MSAARVAVDGSGLERPWAGIGTYTREILAALAAARPESRLTVFGPGPPGRAGTSLEWRAVPRLRFAGRHLLWPLQLRALGADVFFAPAGALPLAGVGAPAVVTAHDLCIYRHPEWFPAGQWLSVRHLTPRSLARASAVLAVSAATARDCQELFGVPAARLEVVPEGAGPQFRPLPPAELEALRIRLGLPRRFILFVSTIEPRKNLETLLEAWGRMRDRPELVVAGGWGWRHESIRARLDRAPDRVRLLGAVDPADLPGLYGLALCLAHPAWYEGFGLTPLEAMASGLPVIASNASSLPEVVGDAGLLVPPADAEAWTAALERLCGDAGLRADLRDRGLARAAGFTWAAAAERTWRVLDRACS